MPDSSVGECPLCTIFLDLRKGFALETTVNEAGHIGAEITEVRISVTW